jgi:hypothetical protein
VLIQLMRDVVERDLTPDGDDLDWAMHRFKWLWELSAGFYNSLKWPAPERVMAKRRCTAPEAEALLRQARAHHELQQRYHRLLRQFLTQGHVPGADTPLLVGGAISRSLEQGVAYRGPALPPTLIGAWRDVKAAWFEDLPERESAPVRVCDYKIRSAVAWARERLQEADSCHGGIIWFYHPEIGEWICEQLKAAAVPHTYAPSGRNEEAFKPGIVVASMAHGIGKNLQHQCRALFVEWRREAAVLEQVIGREHRSGQLADEVIVDAFISNGFDLAVFNAALADADYIQSSTGVAQKVCYATYDPVVPPTNPRLFLKLGIIDSLPSSINVDAWEQITDQQAAAAAATVRGAAYAQAGLRASPMMTG